MKIRFAAPAIGVALALALVGCSSSAKTAEQSAAPIVSVAPVVATSPTPETHTITASIQVFDCLAVVKGIDGSQILLFNEEQKVIGDARLSYVRACPASGGMGDGTLWQATFYNVDDAERYALKALGETTWESRDELAGNSWEFKAVGLV